MARACQRFAGSVLEPDIEELSRAVDDLATDLPEAQSHAERAMSLDRLRITCENVAHQFHGQFHRYLSDRCRQSRIHRTQIWSKWDATPQELLVDWRAEFIAGFEKSHEWPAAVRAARIIKISVQQPLAINAIARSVGCARSTLMRSFKAAYGISMGDYDARHRMRVAVALLREPGSNVGAVAYRVGYHSNKSFYRVLREYTGVVPSHIRHAGRQRSLNFSRRSFTCRLHDSCSIGAASMGTRCSIRSRVPFPSSGMEWRAQRKRAPSARTA